MNYVVLVQSNVMTLDEVPTDIRDETAKWLSFFINGSLDEVNNNDETN